MEIGATLREMAWTQMMNGVVRVGFWTPPHRGVLLNFANNQLDRQECGVPDLAPGC